MNDAGPEKTEARLEAPSAAFGAPIRSYLGLSENSGRPGIRTSVAWLSTRAISQQISRAVSQSLQRHSIFPALKASRPTEASTMTSALDLKCKKRVRRTNRAEVMAVLMVLCGLIIGLFSILAWIAVAVF